MAKNTVRVNVIGDASSYKRAMGETQTATQKAGKGMTDFAKVAATALAVAAAAAVKRFVGDSIRAFSDLEQSVGGTEAVFGEAGDVIDNYAKKSAQALGLAESEFRVATTSIGGQLKRMTGDVDFAADRSIFLTEVAADLAATYGGTTEEAVRALGSAFRGEADPAERFNLDLKIGKVNAKALELGLADTTAEIDDQSRAQAILALITEQSADAQGQFGREADTVAGKEQRLNAKLEDQKALLGQSLAPAWVGMLGIFSDTIDTVSLMTGEITRAELALRDLVATSRGTADSADTFADAFSVAARDMNDFWGAVARGTEKGELFRNELDALWGEMNLGASEIERLARLTEDELVDVLNVTQEQAAFLVGFFNKELDAAFKNLGQNFRDGAEPVQRYTEATDDLTESEEDLEESTDDATQALKDQADELRAQTDPLFNVYKRQQDVTEAKKAYTEALNAGGPGSDAAIAAAWDLTRAEQALDEALVAVRTSGMTRAEFEAWQTGMGRSAQEAGNLADNLENIEGFTWPDPTVRLRVSVPTISYTGDSTLLSPHESGRRLLARGGVGKKRPGGIAATIAEGGSDEAVIPLDRRGVEAMSKAVNQYGSGGPVIHLTVNGTVVTPTDLIDAIHEGLIQKKKRNGPLGL